MGRSRRRQNRQKQTRRLQRGGVIVKNLPIGPSATEQTLKDTWEWKFIQAHGAITDSNSKGERVLPIFRVPARTYILFNSPSGCVARALFIPYEDILTDYLEAISIFLGVSRTVNINDIPDEEFQKIIANVDLKKLPYILRPIGGALKIYKEEIGKTNSSTMDSFSRAIKKGLAKQQTSFHTRILEEIRTKTSLFKTWSGTTSKENLYPDHFFKGSPRVSTSTAPSAIPSVIYDPSVLSESQLSRGIYGPDSIIPEMSLSFMNEVMLNPDKRLSGLVGLGVYNLPLSSPFVDRISVSDNETVKPDDIDGSGEIKKEAVSRIDKGLFGEGTENLRPDLIGEHTLLSKVLADIGKVPAGKLRFIFINSCRQVSCHETERKPLTMMFRTLSLGQRENANETLRIDFETAVKLLDLKEDTKLTFGTDIDTKQAESIFGPLKFPPGTVVWVETSDSLLKSKILPLPPKVNKRGIYYPFQVIGTIKTGYVLGSDLFPFIDWKKGDHCIFKGSKAIEDGTVGIIDTLTPGSDSKRIGVKFTDPKDGQEKIKAFLLRVILR